MTDSNLLRKLTGQAKGLANIIKWDANVSDPSFNNNSNIQSILRTDISNNNGFLVNELNMNIPGGISLHENNSFIDYDISLCRVYKYKLTVNNGWPNSIPYDKYIYIRAIHENITNCKANYNVITNSISITWDELKSNNILNETSIEYNVWICLKSENENLVRFDINETITSIDINSGSIGTLVEFQNEIQNNNTVIESNYTFNIQQGTYFIYITPKYVTSDENNHIITRGYPLKYFKKNGSVKGIPMVRMNIEIETPENFKIQSAYTNGKISFSWNTPKINPTQYLVTFINTTENITKQQNLDANNNENNFTLDNTNLSLSNAFRPGDYTVSLKSRFIVNGNVTLESSSSNTLNFNIPVININFTKQIVDSNGNVTTNIKDVAGIIINWNKFSYVTYYKIIARQFDDTGEEKNSETYYVAHPTNNISLAWNFPQNKSRFIFNISYTTDTSLINNPPNPLYSNALGASYLDPDGVYNPLLN